MRPSQPFRRNWPLTTAIWALTTGAIAAVFSAPVVAAAIDDQPPAKPAAPDESSPGKPQAAPQTRRNETAVAAALSWIAHHQSKGGNWSLKDFSAQCKDKTCTGPGRQESLSAATAMGLLPFLAAGQTHKTPEKGPFKNEVDRGLQWLVAHQKADGDLSAGAEQQMYSHGMAAIALCEAYGMSKDEALAKPAQRAIDFIEAAQNRTTGGWRYYPGEEGDTSVFGWQMTALRSAKLAKLKVQPATLDGARKWLASVTKPNDDGTASGRFSYMRNAGQSTPTMSAVGILGSQELEVHRDDPIIVNGIKYLMENQPDPEARNIYYWYYGTLALHNMANQDWDTWNRKVRKVLVNSQEHEGCAIGSWNPDKPTRDAWGPMGGRLMTTSFSCLTLEVYYRYLPIYKDDSPAANDQK